MKVYAWLTLVLCSFEELAHILRDFMHLAVISTSSLALKPTSACCRFNGVVWGQTICNKSNKNYVGSKIFQIQLYIILIPYLSQ